MRELKRKRKKPRIILGFVGFPCSGQGIAVDYLVSKHGFFNSSISDQIREEIKRRGEEITRERLQAVGGELRQKYGSEVWAKRAWKKVLNSGCHKAVIDGIRARQEFGFFRKIPGFYLIAILAKPKIRFKRMLERKREADPQTWKEFLVMEERDNKKEGRDIEGCLKMADFKVENNGTIEGLEKAIEKKLPLDN